MLNSIQERILQNKIKKGFPIGDVDYDLEKIQEEINEFIEANAANDNENRAEELADIIILVIGISSYFKIDIEKSVLDKLSKIEKRIITKLANGKYTKEEAI